MRVGVVPFKTIYPIWRDKLWKGRRTLIEASSPIDYFGRYDKDIMNFTPMCFACFDGDEIVGVNSLLPTSITYCRSRGIYINSEQRLKGLGRQLMEITLEYARYMCFEYIWSMPRESALPFYLRFGFEQTTEFDDQYEFGPNCFIIKKL